ncbi:MAG: hypothetical protein NZ518_04115 [Dehalococcoidia bacterium]|nr:hypothetical protein [Dehalococcoidia bacterium]
MPQIHPKIRLAPDDLRALRDRVLAFMAEFAAPKIVITKGLDGQPRHRLMGVRTQGFTCYLISVKPSDKLAELQADPTIQIVWYQYDANDPGQDQLLRLVAVTGTAQLVMGAAALRAFPTHSRAKLEAQSDWSKPGITPPNLEDLSDDVVDASRFGIIVRPRKVRTEGFIPGPRYPVYLPVD